jgi:hypothetical protein
MLDNTEGTTMLANKYKYAGLCLSRDPLAVVGSVNETMAALQIGRAKVYELLNSGELESYLEGSSRKVTWRSIEAYIERRLKQEAERRRRVD